MWVRELKANSPVVAERAKNNWAHRSHFGCSTPFQNIQAAPEITAAAAAARGLPPPLQAPSPGHISVYYRSIPHLLHVEYPNLRLLEPSGKCRVYWPLHLITSYSQTGQEFALEAGRNCPQGEALYTFLVASEGNVAHVLDTSIAANVRPSA